MFNNILKTIGSELEQNVLRSLEGTGFDTVRFLNLKSGEDLLIPNALNVAIFSTKAERDIMGTSNYTVPTTGKDGLMQKPPLKLSVDVLFIFNYNNYEIALSIYHQVLAYFYNKDLINIPFDGYPNEVQILLSSFNDRDEIELWNAFNMPGTPVLRYDLKYLMISGDATQLPFIKKIGLDGGVMDPKNSGVDPMVINLLYYPMEGILNAITQKTNSFCSIDRTDNSAKTQGEIDKRFVELIESYTIAQGETEKLLDELGGNEDNPIVIIANPFYHFYPTLIGMINEMIRDQAVLETAGKDDPDLCVLAKDFTVGNKSLTKSLLSRIVETSTYLEITTVLNDGIVKFNIVGESTYGVVDIDSVAIVQNPKDLSRLQFKVKWWELENLLRQLQLAYQEAQDNSLLEPYGEFRKLLERCANALNDPIAQFTMLNEQYNSKNSKPITPEAKILYREAYVKAQSSVNYLKGVLIPIELTVGMQQIFKEQNK